MDTRKNAKATKPGRRWPTSLIWYAAAIALAGLLFQSLLMPRTQRELKYGEFKRALERGQLSEIRVSPSKITGKMREPGRAELASFYTPRLGVENDLELIPLLDKQPDAYEAESEPSELRAVVTYTIFLLVLVGAFFFMMRRMGGAGSPMAFGRSRGRMYAQEDVGVTFQDVAGIDEAVEELREVVEFLKTPEKYQVLGGRIPKGVLLVGSPGTGKTLLGKAVAGEAGVPFFSLSGSEFVEMFVGVGAARVRDMFAQAVAKAPCIIFIDELDALGKTRGVSVIGGHDEREQTLNQLLVEMDGFDSNRGVIIMAATNRPETLDPALLRPGRFDRTIVVDRPDINGREAILRVHVRNVKLDPGMNLRHVASLTPGFVGADLANLVNEAALLAARTGKSQVGQEELEEGVERVLAGLEKKQRVMLPEEKRRIAYHECGHAIVAASLPNTDPVHKVSIIPRGVAALGYTLQRPADDRYLITQSELLSRVKVLLGGTVAEELVFGEASSGAQNDLERASEIARSMIMDYGMSPRLGRVHFRESSPPVFLNGGGRGSGAREYSEETAREIDLEVKQIVDSAVHDVREILSHRDVALHELAARLIEKEVIDAAELKAVLDEFSGGPHIVPGTEKGGRRGEGEGPGEAAGGAARRAVEPS